MLNLNLLLHGDLEDVGAALDSFANEMTNSELRAVLQNLVREVRSLKERAGALEYKTSDTRRGYW